MSRTLALVVLLACCSCMSYPSGKLEELDRNELTSQPRLPAISYQFRQGANPNSPDTAGAWPSPTAELLFCSAFTDARRGAAADDLHVDLAHVNEIRQPVFSLTLGLLTLVSLGILPTYVEEDVVLRARVEYQGKFAGEYLYRDRVHTWVEVFLIPWSFVHDPVNVERSTFENMVLHLLRDLRKDLPQVVSAARP